MDIRQVEKIAENLGGLFSLQQLQLYEADFFRNNLVRWTKQGYLKRVSKGRYCLTGTIQEEQLYLYSNHMYIPSYISMESALRYYDLIPEGVYMTTACTTKKTQQLRGDLGVFSYTHIKPSLMRGYRIESLGSFEYLIAGVEKTIADFFYNKKSLQTQQDVRDLRIDIDHLLSLTTPKLLRSTAAQFKNKRVLQLMEYLLTLS